jgi:ribosomal protein S18 acetylase RimI-like enzyme
VLSWLTKHSRGGIDIRRATPDDAPAIVSVLEVIATERIHSAIDQVWSVEEERRYIGSLSEREVIHVAFTGRSGAIGLQILDRWSPLSSMSHVGQLGTFVLPGQRGRGVGRTLWEATLAFARDAGYRKLVIQVRASNARAQAFYQRLGFAACGRLAAQVIIDGKPDDEILMELFLT